MRRFLVVGASLALSAAGRMAAAQTGSTLDFVRAVGARSIGIGQATTAGADGSEAVWVNPALVARSRREVSADFRNKASAADPEADLAVAGVIPVEHVGAVALFIRYLNYGQQDVASGPTETVGSFNNINYIVGAAFATTFFERWAVGITAKRLILTFPCTGDCSQLGSGSATEPAVSALDLGTQLFVRGDSSVSVAGSVTNLGSRLQVKDSPQADPLPSHANLGVLYAPRLSIPDVRVRISADMVRALSGDEETGYRLGVEVSYLDRYRLRAGYIRKGPVATDSPTLGFGVASGKLRVDIAQVMASTGTQSAKPTFLALRYVF